MVSVPLFMGMFFFWYTNVCEMYTEHAREIDEMFAKCRSEHSESPSLAVVLPFSPDQINYLFTLLYVWSTSDFFPLFANQSSPEFQRRTHLVFYPTRDDDGSIAEMISAFFRTHKQVKEMVDSVFATHEILPGNLPDRFDLKYRDYVHGQWVASGKTEMFYPMVTRTAPSKGFGFILYHELDMFPLRHGWLSTLLSMAFATDADFWFVGSQQRQRRIFGGRIHGHINANMLVRVDNACVHRFLDRVSARYRYLPYDSSMMRYLVRRKNLREAQHIMARFRHTEIIGNFADEDVNTTDLREMYAEMYLVHGLKYAQEMTNRFKVGL